MSVKEHVKYPLQENKIVCEKCVLSFSSENAMKEHMKIHNQNKCPYCKTIFWTEEHLKAHIDNYHEQQQIYCKECKLTFKTVDSLNEHNIAKNLFKCEVCECDFRTICELEKHKQMKHGKDEFSCAYCQLQFSSNKSLNSHLQSHIEKNFECRQCEKVVKAPDELEKHMLEHENGKDFKCNVCTKKFSSQDLLNEHIKTHAMSNKKCQSCEKEFKTQVHLDNHMAEFHKESPQKFTKQYNCKDCSFQADNWSSLKRHIQILKHNPSDFSEKCYTCQAEFTSYWTLMNHRREEHPSNKKCRYFFKQECSFSAKTQRHVGINTKIKAMKMQRKTPNKLIAENVIKCFQANRIF